MHLLYYDIWKMLNRPTTKTLVRCAWVGSDSQMQKYHDEVWGVPKLHDRDIFEAIILDTFQAGLSWKCILHKRDNFAKAFYNFDVKKVSQMTKRDVARLMKDAGIIRNRLKIQSAITNAQAFLTIQKEFGTLARTRNYEGGFAKYIWQFTDHRTLVNKWKHKIPASTKISDLMSTDMKKRGFKFVGTTICYAFMQGIGMVHDHQVNCMCYGNNIRKK